MLARFFIDRPILAWVISIVIVLMGLIAVALLPIAQYPPITPTVVAMDSDPLAANVAKPEVKKDEKVAAVVAKTGTSKE